MNRTNDSVRPARIGLLLLMVACFASCGDSDDAGTSAGATKLTTPADRLS
ncbi:MAG: hypothetical protein M3163_16295 [Actinomycetota bacterium]|nr:hypothetical protein [Actinomycetota bacterium]